MVLFIVILNYLETERVQHRDRGDLRLAPAIMRIVRGLTLDTKTRDYVFAAQTRGENPLYIMLVELLPNARGPIIVDAACASATPPWRSPRSPFSGWACDRLIRTGGLMIKEAARPPCCSSSPTC